MRKPELLVGVGSFPCAIAAVENGADAVFFGVKGYNMRDLGTNFKKTEIKKLIQFLHNNGVKGYLALNTIIFEKEMNKVDKVLAAAKKAGVDAVIVSDLGVMALAKKHGLRIHLSTQASAANEIALEQYKKLGARRIVLARELDLKQIKKLSKKAGSLNIELEAFVHGAMCIAVSGRCFMSHELFGKSANKGECLQVCRRAFFLDGHAPDYEKKELLISGNTILSAKDLKTIDFLDKIVASGISSLKIEGRTKPVDYVREVSSCYSEAINALIEKKFTKKKISDWNARLENVFNRGFSPGFYFGPPGSEGFAEKQGSRQKQRRKEIGLVTHYFSKKGVAEIKLSGELKIGDKLIFEGNTTFFEQEADSIAIENEFVDSALKKKVGLKVKSRVRKNDRVFRLVNV